MAIQPDPAAGLSQIGQIAVPVRDLARAVAFYRDALGLKYLFEVPGMAFFDCDGIRLMLSLPEGNASGPPGSILYFRVSDLQRRTESLRSLGVTITGEPGLIARMPDHELWMAFFEDTEGNTMGLMSELPLET